MNLTEIDLLAPLLDAGVDDRPLLVRLHRQTRVSDISLTVSAATFAQGVRGHDVLFALSRQVDANAGVAS